MVKNVVLILSTLLTVGLAFIAGFTWPRRINCGAVATAAVPLTATVWGCGAKPPLGGCGGTR